MMDKKKFLGVVLSAAGLGGCMSYNPHGYTNYQAYTYEGSIIYPEDYEGYEGYAESQGYRYQTEGRGQVVVPESYHVGSYHSPTSHKDRDRRWVDQQNPGGYTIELAHGEKASQVAGVLYKAPKKDRMAQIKYHQDGKTYYKGLYGSYSSYEAAQQALSSLPENIRQGARITSWGSVQGKVQ
ncbi:SPOR domain-containing protein [Legionella londiniensis]|uniref:SPOR domain-containing protein n=1 Tax=Legionella londiniensis TaxID=45068 RepID=UPI00399CEB89